MGRRWNELLWVRLQFCLYNCELESYYLRRVRSKTLRTFAFAAMSANGLMATGLASAASGAKNVHGFTNR